MDSGEGRRKRVSKADKAKQNIEQLALENTRRVIQSAHERESHQRRERDYNERLRELDRKQQLEIEALRHSVDIQLASLQHAAQSPIAIPKDTDKDVSHIIQLETDLEDLQREYNSLTRKMEEALRKGTPPDKKGIEEVKEIGDTLAKTQDAVNALRNKRRNIRILNSNYAKYKREIDERLGIPSGLSLDNFSEALELANTMGRREAKEFNKRLVKDKSGDIDKLIKGAGSKMRSMASDDMITTNVDLEKMLQPLDKYGFIGVYMSDEIDHISARKLSLRGSFIMNLDTSDGPGYHWIAVYWDLNEGMPDPENVSLTELNKYRNRGLFYFDPFGRPPSDDFRMRIEVLLNKIFKKYGIEPQEIDFEHNDDRLQNLKSKECGYFCAKWLIDMYNGVPFEQARDLSKEGETKIAKFIEGHKE